MPANDFALKQRIIGNIFINFLEYLDNEFIIQIDWTYSRKCTLKHINISPFS